MTNGIAILKKIRRKYYSRKRSKYVKEFYQKNYDASVVFNKNIWNGNRYWDYFYQSRPDSIKSEYYVPLDYYNYKIEPCLNDYTSSVLVKEKNLYDQIFRGLDVKMPKTILRCFNGIFMDHNYKTIANLSEYIKQIDQDVIVKQANFLHGGGENIEKYNLIDNKLLNSKHNHPIDFNDLEKRFKGNFIVQSVVKQHAALGKFHATSLNTFKVYSYRSVKDNEVHVLCSTFRAGSGGAFLDNTSSGGLMIGVNYNQDTGEARLRKFGFDQWGYYSTEHPDTNIKFKNYIIPKFDGIVNIVKKLANVVPYQRLIGWDFSIDEEGNPVLIELNIGSGVWGHQVANGEPLFGKYSHEIKEYIDKHF